MSKIKLNKKICECHFDYWEETVIITDDNFKGRKTVYSHCTECGDVVLVIDYESGEVLHKKNKSKS